MIEKAVPGSLWRAQCCWPWCVAQAWCRITSGSSALLECIRWNCQLGCSTICCFICKTLAWVLQPAVYGKLLNNHIFWQSSSLLWMVARAAPIRCQRDFHKQSRRHVRKRHPVRLPEAGVYQLPQRLACPNSTWCIKSTHAVNAYRWNLQNGAHLCSFASCDSFCCLARRFCFG